MILEEEKHKYRDIVTRICDHCGKKERRTFGLIEEAKRNRKGKISNQDYCKKCSYIYRQLEQPTMEKSASWNGGRYLTEYGYYRIYIGNGKYLYEHKVIFEKHLGRKIGVGEKVHHIDLNKVNNSIENLYLCKDKVFHWACHQSMEKCAFSLFGKKIWFDYETQKYTLNKIDCSKHGPIMYNISKDSIRKLDKIKEIKCFKSRRRETSGFYFIPTNPRKYKKMIHTMVAEVLLGRNLFANETIHHINGNTLNNEMYNLAVMTRSEHKLCHYSLQYCIAELFLNGEVKFKDGEYYVNKEANV